MTQEADPALIYEANLVPAIFAPLAQLLIARAAPRPGEHVLDAACGTGIVARSVAPLVSPGGAVAGIDLDPPMIAAARRLAPGIAYQEGDLQHLPFADRSFDLVLCQQGLQFLSDRAAGLSEIHRVLLPGGRVALAIWTAISNAPGQAALFAALGARLGVDMSQPAAWSLTDEAQVLGLVKAAGFVDVVASVAPITARFPSGRRFVEIMLDGSSKATRQALAQIRPDERAAFIDAVADRLRSYETAGALTLPMETRLLLAHKR